MKAAKLILSIISILIFHVSGCVESEDFEKGSEDLIDAQEILAADSRIGLSTNVQYSDINLTGDEIASLQFIREEEKLARDVYIYLYDEWGLMPFKNISKSEQIHMDAILVLLNRYQIEDPVKDNDYGVFENQELQELYNHLIDEGSMGVIEALTVGALIEETDINDIQIILDNKITKSDLSTVLNNLQNGSMNHLKAFTRNLLKYNIDYEPEILDIDFYKQIID